MDIFTSGIRNQSFYGWPPVKHFSASGQPAFLYLGEPQLVVLMMVSILVNWLAGKLIGKYDTYKKWILVGAVAVDLSLLGYYKYAGFLVEAVNALAGRALIPVPDIRLPIGISFSHFRLFPMWWTYTEGRPRPRTGW